MSSNAIGRSGAVVLWVFLSACGDDAASGGPPPGADLGGAPVATSDNAAVTPNGVATMAASPPPGPSVGSMGAGMGADMGAGAGTMGVPQDTLPTPNGNVGSGDMGASGGSMPMVGVGMEGAGPGTDTDPVAGMMGMDPSPESDPMAGALGSDGSVGGTLGGPLMFTGEFTAMDGAIIEDTYKCPMPFGGGMGQNISPPLEWSGGPAETLSFGLVLYDTGFDMLHWAVWDIPASATSLPEGLPAGYDIPEPTGAHQAAAMGNDDHAYAGPCSAGAIAARAEYEYRLYALDQAMLELTDASSAAEAQAAIEAAALDSVTWTGRTQ